MQAPAQAASQPHIILRDNVKQPARAQGILPEQPRSPVPDIRRSTRTLRQPERPRFACPGSHHGGCAPLDPIQLDFSKDMF